MIDEYIEAATSLSTFKEMVKSLESQGMTLTMIADGDNLVYKYQYTVEVADNAVELIEDSFEQNEAVLAQSADVIRVEAPCVESVVWEYYTIDGEFLTSFKR